MCVEKRQPVFVFHHPQEYDESLVNRAAVRRGDERGPDIAFAGPREVALGWLGCRGCGESTKDEFGAYVSHWGEGKFTVEPQLVLKDLKPHSSELI